MGDIKTLQRPMHLYGKDAVVVSEHDFFALVEKTLGKKLPKSDQRRFEGCVCAQDFVTVVAESPIDEFLEINLWRLCQIYVCLLGGFKLAKVNQKGYDALDAFEMEKKIRAGTIEVKHSTSDASPYWNVRIKDATYDVLVFVGMDDTRNPADGSMLVIPGKALKEIVSQRDRIVIRKSKYHRWRGGVLNDWWNWHLLNHNQLRDTVSRYVMSDCIEVVRDPYEGLPLFDLRCVRSANRGL